MAEKISRTNSRINRSTICSKCIKRKKDPGEISGIYVFLLSFCFFWFFLFFKLLTFVIWKKELGNILILNLDAHLFINDVYNDLKNKNKSNRNSSNKISSRNNKNNSNKSNNSKINNKSSKSRRLSSSKPNRAKRKSLRKMPNSCSMLWCRTRKIYRRRLKRCSNSTERPWIRIGNQNYCYLKL